MDLWTYDRYRAPRLSVDRIEAAPAERLVILESGSARYRLGVDDPEAAAAIAEQLATLREADAPLWGMLRESEPDSPWRALGTFLDRRSLISEGWDESEAAAARQRERIEQLVIGTADAILGELPPERRAAAAGVATRLGGALAGCQTAGRRSVSHGTDPFDAGVTPNFYEALLALEFDYLAVACPPTLAAVARLLVRLGWIGAPARLPLDEALDDSAGVFDEHDLASHLWLVGQAIARATGEDAARMPTAPIPPAQLRGGLEFMRQVEMMTRDTLALWGVNPYVAAIQDGERPHRPLVAGPYIEQYHVTRRFVEIVAPLLSRRLSRPLRALAYRYFSEEVGHEELESTTCEELGVTPRALNEMVPLPLHFAFVDALTQVARTDPIASFAAIMVIEGVFGEPPRMSLRLEAIGAGNPEPPRAVDEHEELNISLNHNSIARDAFELVDAVGPERGVEAMRKILFLLELNQRAWAGITAHYGSQPTLVLQGLFGAPLDPRV